MTSPPPSVRVHPAVDWLKGLAIVAVVTAHSGAFALSAETTGLDRYVRVTLAAFHVPVFLMISGYLHATGVLVGSATIWRRWRSILGAYLVASVVMLSLGLEFPRPVQAWPSALIVGSALGIYYYVPVWVACVATGAIWSRLSHRQLAMALIAVSALTLVRQIWRDAPIGFVWAIRDPLLMGWLFCYVFGWCARRFAWDRWIDANRWSVALALLCCFRWACLPDGAPHLTRVVYSVGIAWLVIICCRRPAPRPLRWLARETLLVYLWHVPVTMALWESLRAWPDVVRLPVSLAVALAVVTGGVAGLRILQRVAATIPRDVRTPEDDEVDTRRAA